MAAGVHPHRMDSSNGVEDAIRRTQAGEREAFQVVVERSERPLRLWLAGLAGPGIELDDIAQRAFITAYQRLHTYQAGTAFLPWLCAIAHNHLRDERKRLARHGTGALSELDQLAWTAGQESAPYGEETVADLRRCLALLQPSQADLIDRHYRQGHPLADIADILATTAGAVRTRLYAVRKRLAACLQLRAQLGGGA
jgi:RNA polymerase sigma-70 factor (ECF subfamily)